MKKLTALILAGLLTATTILSGCTDKKTTDNKDVPSVSDTQNEEGKKTGTPAELLASVESYADFEKKLTEIVPKKELDSEILLNISGVPVSAAMLRYAVIACNNQYASSTEENVEQVIEDEINNYFRINAYVVNKADEMGITITDEDFKANFTDVLEQFNTQFGDEFESVLEMYTLQTPYAYFLSTYYNFLYSRIYDEYSANEEFAAQVRQAVLDDMTNSETPYVRAKHILVCFPEEGEGENGEVTQAQKDETLAKANDVLELVQDGGDFDALVKEYGEDPGMESYPGGYYFTTGEMVAPFEETAFALEEGEISGLVETNYGYHIIQRLPLDDDAIIATDMYMNKGYELFSNELDVLAEDYEIIYSENYDARHADFYAEFEEMMNPAPEEETQAEGEEHDHSEEAEGEEAEDAAQEAATDEAEAQETVTEEAAE